MPWFTLAIALVGAVLGIYSSLATRDAAKRETAQKIQELLDEAFDLLGGEEGTPFISGSLRIRDPIVLTKVDRLISEALLLDPGSSGAHMRRGDLLDVKGLPEQAITAYRKAIELDPNNAAAHSRLALKDKGQLDDAIAEYRKAIQLDPNYAQAKRNLEIALGQ